MKKYRLALVLITAVILLSCLAGCSSGVPVEKYNDLARAYEGAQGTVQYLNKQLADQLDQWEMDQAELQAQKAKVAELEAQVGGLKEQATLTGATPAETAEKIVKNYHETHVYSTYDMFICSDMSSEVWNMLKAQGIKAIVVVGNKDTAVNDILQSNHAWVLAEVAPGEYLALETTGGFVVPKSQNALYYRGWSFDSPAELKANNDLVKEYNIRVGIRNQIAAEDRAVVAERDQATDQNTADKLEAVHDKLVELIKPQEAELNSLKAELDGLATRLP